MGTALKHKQLFIPLKDFQRFDYFSSDELHTKSGDNIPFISWPDGSPCSIANLYVLHLLTKKGRGGGELSRTGSKCGTLGQYVLQFGQLLSYCFHNNIALTDLTDSSFAEFIHKLKAQKSTLSEERSRTKDNSVIATGKVCLEFLEFVGKFHGDQNFVSEHGTIRATREKASTSRKHSAHPTSSGFNHNSFGVKSRIHTRNPIAQRRISELRTSAFELTKSSHIRNRRSLFISLLEHTGARRGEISELTVPDIRNAIRMNNPKLRMITLKQGLVSERLIPVSKILLSEAIRYIDIYRSQVLRRHKNSDHGFLLVSETTGNPLSAAYLTNEIGLIGRHAKIEEQACAHMFRHAFITNLFVSMIERYEFENPSAFRHEMIMNAIFLEEIRQITGHKDPLSLVPYIHLAFKQIGSFSRVMASVNRSKVLHIFDQKHEELLHQLEQGIPVPEYKRRYEELVRLRDEDLLIASERDS